MRSILIRGTKVALKEPRASQDHRLSELRKIYGSRSFVVMWWTANGKEVVLARRTRGPTIRLKDGNFRLFPVELLVRL